MGKFYYIIFRGLIYLFTMRGKEDTKEVNSV